jgi:hypothetical protein
MTDDEIVAVYPGTVNDLEFGERICEIPERQRREAEDLPKKPMTSEKPKRAGC